MLGIGIHQNVLLIGAKTNDKGTLELAFDEAKNVGKEVDDVFESSQTAKVSNDGKAGITILIFPFKKPSGPRNEDKTDDELLEMISGDIKKVKNQLTQLLLIYLTTDEVKWDPYYQTGVTKENYRTEYLNNSTLETIFSNYANQFIAMVKPFLGNTARGLRIKIIRQSKEKNFPTISGRFLEDQPWVESMDVPEKLSKISFTQYELDNGYDSAKAYSKDNADPKNDIPDTAASQESVFGKR